MIFRSISVFDQSDSIGARFEDEKQKKEKHRKELEEGHLYLTVKILNDEIMRTHHGFDLCDSNSQFMITKLRKDMKLKDLKVSVKVTLVDDC